MNTRQNARDIKAKLVRDNCAQADKERANDDLTRKLKVMGLRRNQEIAASVCENRYITNEEESRIKERRCGSWRRSRVNPDSSNHASMAAATRILKKPLPPQSSMATAHIWAVRPAPKSVAPDPGKPGTLRVHVKRASGLKSSDMFGGKSDPFVQVTAGSKRFKLKTKTIENQNDPAWNEHLDFEGQFDVLTDTPLSVDVRDSDMITSESLGEVTVDLEVLKRASRKDYKMQLPTQGAVEFAISWFAEGKVPPIGEGGQKVRTGRVFPGRRR